MFQTDIHQIKWDSSRYNSYELKRERLSVHAPILCGWTQVFFFLFQVIDIYRKTIFIVTKTRLLTFKTTKETLENRYCIGNIIRDFSNKSVLWLVIHKSDVTFEFLRIFTEHNNKYTDTW